MAVEYFGNNVEGASNEAGYQGYTIYNAGKVWTCPGAGKYDVRSLAFYGYLLGATSYARLAIYTTAGNFVMQGDARLVGDNTTKWYEHTAFVDQAGSPIASPQLDGSTDYWLAVSFENSSNQWRYTAGTSGDMHYVGGTYPTTGFPATLSGGSHVDAREGCFRCGVEAAAGGGLSIPVAMHHYKMQRGVIARVF